MSTRLLDTETPSTVSLAQAFFPSLRPLSVWHICERQPESSHYLVTAAAQVCYFQAAATTAIRKTSINVAPASFVKGVGIASLGMTVGLSTLVTPLTALAAPPEATNIPNTIVIQKGDTLTKISQQRYGSPNSVPQIAKANGLSNPDRIYAGATLQLPSIPPTTPPTSPTTLVVQPGDTLRGISYKTLGDESRFTEIAQTNKIANPDRINSGQKLTIPSTTPPAAPASTTAAAPPTAANQAQSGTGGATGDTSTAKPASLAVTTNRAAFSFDWPTHGVTVKGGEFGSYRGGTGVYANHTGLDLAAPQGTAITAAAAGKVTHAGPEGSYGNTVVIDHGNGYQTRYAHLLSWKVREGETVNQGQLIGLMGATGNATGPHLHFEVIKNGNFVSPLAMLPNS